MENKKLLSALTTTALSLLALCLVLIAGTYAWFTFDPYTNVTPLEGKISKGEANLLISESRDGPFDKQCALNPAVFSKVLRPVSTHSLNQFYSSIAQNKDGYSVAFQEVTRELDQYLIHGTVFLQCLDGSCDVFFQTPDLKISGDAQILSAGRLGIRITDKDGMQNTLIFKLDSLGSTEKAELRDTVLEENVVLSGIREAGTPVFVQDPGISIGSYQADAENPQKLCSLQSEEIAQVDYWLYLEGCDTACFNPVLSQDITLQLGFAGEPIEQEEETKPEEETTPGFVAPRP